MYNVLYRTTDQNIFWTPFRDEEAFKKEGIPEKDVIEKGISAGRAAERLVALRLARKRKGA